MEEELDLIISLDSNELIDLTRVNFKFDNSKEKAKTKLNKLDLSIFTQEDMIDFSHLD